VVLLGISQCRGVDAGSVTIHRDEWGVPHVYAQTPADGAYGLGWAQAEDRLEQILRNYRLAEGTMAEAFGPEWVEHDWQQRICGHRVVCERRYSELPADLREIIEAFQEGVKAYMGKHRDSVPDWAPEIEPWHVPALGRHIIFGWPIGRAKSELERRDEVRLPFGSNQWAVRPERTAEGCAILCIDPHIPWDGAFRFHEFRMRAGELNVCGFGAAGAPMIGLGHNDHLGWACTTGGPDTTDVYVEEINPRNPLQYRYDDEWRDVKVESIRIEVKGREPVERKLHRTHHGPIVLREKHRAYAVACPYFSEIDLVTQMYRMCLARNLTEFQSAVAMNQLMEQNLMYADVVGNIFYVRTGRVPIRPSGFDFSRPVPGNTSATEWLGLHPMKDFVQLLNPPRGYMQNCNIGPDTMLVDCPIDPDDYPDYIYNSKPGRTNSRGRRAVRLLESVNKLTVELAVEIVLDTHADGAEQWQEAVRKAAERHRRETRDMAEALNIFANWDGFMNADSSGATLYRALREFAEKRDIDAEAVSRGAGLPGRQQRRLLAAFREGVDYLKEHHGRVSVPWGDVHRIRRGGRSWPAAGGQSGGGATLRAISSDMASDGAFYGRGGQQWTQLVIFREGRVESFSATPYGQSDNPDSPHYTDQAERLFSQSRLKPTWFHPDSLKGHVESQITLRMP